MEVVVEHIFSSFMIFLLVSACLFGVSSYIGASNLNFESTGSLKGVFEYLSSALFSDDVSNPIISSKIDLFCSKFFPNAYLSYDLLKGLLGLNEYGFTLSLHYPITVNLVLNGRKLWCSIVNSITSLPIEGRVFLYAFVNGSLYNRIALYVSGSGCQYQFKTRPEVVIAIAFSNGLWGFNWTGLLSRLLVLPFDGHLYLSGASISQAKFLLSDCFLKGGKIVELTTGESLEFFSRTLDEEVTIKNGERRVLLYVSGKGRIIASLGIADGNYNIEKIVSQRELHINSPSVEKIAFTLNLESSISLSKDDRLFLRMFCTGGSVKLYFGSKLYPSRVNLSLISALNSRGLFFKAPASIFNLYLITCNGEFSGLDVEKVDSNLFRVNYIATPSLLLAFSPEHHRYYISPYPNIVKNYGGISSSRNVAFSKIISILGYPYILRVYVWRYLLRGRVGELSFSMNVNPSQLSILQGSLGKVKVDVFGSKRDESLIVSLNAVYSQKIFRNVTFTRMSGLVPFTSNLLIQSYENASPGVYSIIIEGIGNDGSIINCEVKVSILPTPESDFTINVNPTIVSVCQWSNTSSTVFVGSIQNYRYNVSLTVNDIPSGVQISFDPSSGIPPFQSTCLIMVEDVSAGVYEIEIIGVGGDDRNHSSILILNVTSPPPDFKVYVNPDKVTVRRGRLVRFLVKVVSINDFNELVTLKLTNLPPFSFYRFNPSEDIPSFNSTLRIFISHLTPRGTYYLVITATSNSMMRMAIICLEVV